MKKFTLSILVFLAFIGNTTAAERITVLSSATASQPNTAPLLKTLDVANASQSKYEFVLDFRPGGAGVIALKAMDQNPLNRLATVAPAFVENAKSGLINESDYVAISTQGDACWAVITNVGDTAKGLESLRGQKEITVGGTGYGNAAHLTSLIIGERYGFGVRYIVYKANYEALKDMAAGLPVNFVLERVANYQIFKERNPKLQILGINCPARNPLMPNIKTVKEQGFDTPSIFLTIVASIQMPEDKRKEIGKILEDAQTKLGLPYMIESSDMFPPSFNKNKLTVEQYFKERVDQMKRLTSQYETQINQAK
jgi:hypothetical protein